MKKLLGFVLTGFVFIGCDSYERIEKTDYRGEAIHIGNGVYVKKMYIQGVDALVQCDNEGKVLSNPNIHVSYMQGKVKKNVSTITPLGTKIPGKGKYTFSCDTLIECQQQISIVKQSLGE